MSKRIIGTANDLKIKGEIDFTFVPDSMLYDICLINVLLGGLMDSSMKKINYIIAALISCIAAYTLLITVNSIADVYQNSSAFFDQQGSLYPALITVITALVPVSVAITAYLVYLNKRTYIILLPIAHVVLLFLSYAAYSMVFLILIWWFSKYAVKST
jgi:hypothetical protein